MDYLRPSTMMMCFALLAGVVVVVRSYIAMAGFDFGVLWVARCRGLKIIRSLFEIAVERAANLPAECATCIIESETS